MFNYMIFASLFICVKMGACVGRTSRMTEAQDAKFRRHLQRDIQYAYYVAWELAQDPKVTVFWKQYTQDTVLFHNMLSLPANSFPWSSAEISFAQSLVIEIRNYLLLFCLPMQFTHDQISIPQNKLFLHITGDNFIHTDSSQRRVHVQFSLSDGPDFWRKVQV